MNCHHSKPSDNTTRCRTFRSQGNWHLPLRTLMKWFAQKTNVLHVWVKTLPILMVLACAQQGAQAAVTMTFSQVGNDVVVTAIGSINTTGLPSPTQTAYAGDVWGARSLLVAGSGNAQQYSLATLSPTALASPFGSSARTDASSNSGDSFGIFARYASSPYPYLILPAGYVSGASINSNSTFSNQTFTTLNLNPGTYTLSWQYDFVTIVIASSTSLSPSTQTAINGTVGSNLTSATLSTSGFGGSITYSISPSLPSGLNLNTSTGVISGTPTSSQAATSYTITGTGSSSGTATSSVSIAIAGAAQGTLQVSLSPANLRVNQTGTLSTTGGSGSGAVSYAVTSGNCTVSSTTLSAPSSAGTCVVTATKAADQSYTESTATVTVVVTARPSLEEAMDATVRGTIAAQASTVSRFSSAQMSNVSGHLSQLSTGFSASGNRLAIGLSGLFPGPSAQVLPVLLAATSQTDQAMPSSQNDGPSEVAQVLAKQRTEMADEPMGQTSFWAAGDVSRGRLGVDQNVNRFHTDGVTLGMDYRWDPRSILGLALGYGTDRTNIDVQGSQVNASQVSLTAYGVYTPTAQWVMDGQLGYANTSFANARYSQFNGVLLHSQRRATTWFGAVGLSAPLEMQGLSIRPFVRASAMHASLGAYTEEGDSNALAFDMASQRQASLATGVMVIRSFVQGDGARWIPSAKLELRRNSNTSLNQAVSFSDTPSETGLLQIASSARDVQMLGIGLSYMKPSGMRLHLGLESARGAGGYQMGGVKLALSMPM